MDKRAAFASVHSIAPVLTCGTGGIAWRRAATDRITKRKDMKSIKMLSMALCAFALTFGTANVQAGCCADAKKAGKACAHKCCVEAAKAKKVCEKCNPKKGDKKDGQK